MADIGQLTAAVNQLVAAYNNNTAALNQANQGRQATTTLTPWEGGDLDYNKKGDTTLFADGSSPLPTKFTGKPSEMANFIEELKARAALSQWGSATHGILTVSQNHVDLDLLNNWGRIRKESVETARAARVAGNDLRMKQNAIMMYHCVFKTLSGSALTSITTDRENPVPNDGPSLFTRVVNNTFPDLLHQALTTRENLLNLHPKKYSYNIKSITGYLKVCFNLIEGSSDHPMSEIDKIFYTKRVLEMIKTPVEFANAMQLQFSKAGDDPNYKASILMLKAEAKEAEIKAPNPNNWKPSDKSPQEQVLAMMTQATQNKKPEKSTGNDQGGGGNASKQRPPFFKSKGKLGDKKKWKEKWWYYCPSPHKNGHWVTHDPKDCRLGQSNKEKDEDQSPSSSSNNSSKSNTVQVDVERIKQAMAAIVEQPPTDPEHAANAFLALIQSG